MDYKKVQERMQRIKDTQFAKHRAHIHNRGDIVVVDWKRLTPAKRDSTRRCL